MKTRVLVLIFFSVLISCAPKKEGSNCVGAPESGIEGTWQALCASGSSTSYRVTITILCSTAAQQVDFYSGVGCIEANKTRILTNAGGYFTTGGASTSVIGATEFDNNNGTPELRPTTTAEANAMNTSSYCGKTNWTVNVKQGVSGTCGSDFYGYSGSKSYSIYQVVNSLLYFGTSSGSADGSTVQNRHSTLGSVGYSLIQ